VQDFANAWGGAAHLTTDFAEAVMKVKGLADMLASDKDGLVLKRLQLLDMARSVARIVPIDEDEDLERKSTPISGLAELMDKFGENLCGATNMPTEILFGKSHGGLGQGGDQPIQMRQYYDWIKSEQERNVVPQLSKLVRYMWASAEGPTHSQIPDKWSVDPLPLWGMSELQEAEMRNKQAATDQIYMDYGVLSESEVRDSRFGGDDYSLHTTIAQVDDLPVPADPKEMAQDPHAETENQEAKPRDSALQAGQITALLQILTAYKAGDITYGMAIESVRVGFQLDEVQAKQVVGPELDEEEIMPPTAPPSPFGVSPVEESTPDGEVKVDAEGEVAASSSNAQTVALNETLVPMMPPGNTPAVPDDGRPRTWANEDSLHADYIHKRGNKWVVLSKAGKVLGKHKTRDQALNQLRAVETNKADV
jgi:hypothetical protein